MFKYAAILCVLAIAGGLLSTAHAQPTTATRTLMSDAVIAQARNIRFDDKGGVEILPPLSLEECSAAIRLLRLHLERQIETGRSMDIPSQQVDSMFDFLLDYLKLTDRKHSNLGSYTWYYIGDKRVSISNMDRDIFYVTPALSNVSAISFRASEGDVWIDKIEVVDINDTRYTFIVKRKILDELPRKEVCYLPLPVTVKEIVTEYSGSKKQNPRLQMYGGVSREPEHMKAVIHYLREARQRIGEDRLKDAVEALVNAQKRLTLFIHRRD